MNSRTKYNTFAHWSIFEKTKNLQCTYTKPLA